MLFRIYFFVSLFNTNAKKQYIKLKERRRSLVKSLFGKPKGNYSSPFKGEVKC
ncbi:hypothetical protein UPTC15622_00935 [Campylobacter lari]